MTTGIRWPVPADPVGQSSTPTSAAAQALGQWEGLGEGYPGFTVTAVPPDTNMAVGPNHIVQWVNNAFVVFDKQGNQLRTPVDDGTFWGDTPVAIAAILTGQSDNRLSERGLVMALHRLIALGTAGLTHQSASMPFTRSLLPSVVNGDPAPLGT